MKKKQNLDIQELDDDICTSLLDDDEIFDKIIYRKNLDELNDIYSSLNKTELIKKDKNSHESLDEASQRLKYDGEVIHTFTENAKDDRRLKKIYAIWLMLFFLIQLITFNVVFILAGCKVLNYSENTFNIYVTGGLIEIVSLVVIIVKYLFKDNISGSLNNILEKNKTDK